MTQKFVGYYRLLEALDKPGCPVCRCVAEDGRRNLTALLYEHVTDAETRRRLRAAWGLCNWHTWMLPTLGTARVGAAILYEDLLRVCARRVSALGGRRQSRLGRFKRRWRLATGSPPPAERPARRAACPVCTASRNSEGRYLETALDFIRDPEFAEAYGRSTGLCMPHVLRTLQDHGDGEDRRRLLSATLGKWAGLGRQLEGFVRKHEYRNTEPVSDVESSACTTAFEILAGAAGVFGNDLHTSRREE